MRQSEDVLIEMARESDGSPMFIDYKIASVFHWHLIVTFKYTFQL